MAGLLIVPSEIFSLVADLVDAAGKINPAWRFAWRRNGARLGRAVGWPEGICGEKGEDVCEHQLLMLLLVMNSDLERMDQGWRRIGLLSKKLRQR